MGFKDYKKKYMEMMDAPECSLEEKLQGILMISLFEIVSSLDTMAVMQKKSVELSKEIRDIQQEAADQNKSHLDFLEQQMRRRMTPGPRVARDEEDFR